MEILLSFLIGINLSLKISYIGLTGVGFYFFCLSGVEKIILFFGGVINLLNTGVNFFDFEIGCKSKEFY